MGGLIERKANDALASSRAGQGMAWEDTINARSKSLPRDNTAAYFLYCRLCRG